MKSVSEKPVPGQRWVSESEPELGLGILLAAEYGRVELLFPAADERRTYSLESAPLRRVEYKEGDRITTHDGETRLVDSIREEAGLLVYETRQGEIPEAMLSDQVSFASPEDRLLAGQVDDPESFSLRLAALQQRAKIRKSPVRGFAGARIDLIRHQLAIAAEVSGRLRPRVLLADEVGLGKTIEACLILHRLHLCGRADRVLILLPESLVHQWFVELLRRFNLLFSLYDEERCEALASSENPFLEAQLVITPIQFLAENRERMAQVLEAGWDLLVVDEAHHLEWSPEEASTEYSIVEALARQTEGLLLLTATPQQLGPAGHFARLRLLDHDRYQSLDAFIEEQSHYEEVAELVDAIKDGGTPETEQLALMKKMAPSLSELGEKLAAGNESVREGLVERLLDAFGTGRVLFRNRRAQLEGFPSRKLHLAPLEDNKFETRIDWLIEKLVELEEQKILLICRTRRLVDRIAEAILKRRQVKLAKFHEGLELVQRDRNAAYFAEEEGARLLICSEIGSEGRNFQFAHHLVLFDLPEDIELLEQRIGRLDRIGQTSTIHIHLPHAEHGAELVRVRFLHEGLNAFEQSLPGASEIVHELGERLETCVKKPDPGKLEQLIADAREVCARIQGRLERGQDRLLTLNSARGGQAEACAEAIRQWDEDRRFEDVITELFEAQGLRLDEFGGRRYKIEAGYQHDDCFLGIPEDGKMITFARETAIAREDLDFMGPDHPYVRGALDAYLAEDEGQAAFGVYDSQEGEGVWLEVIHLLECVAPPALHMDRFLSPTPVLNRVNEHLEALEGEIVPSEQLEPSHPHGLIDKKPFRRELFPAMLDKATELAEAQRETLVAEARQAMQKKLEAEISRLKTLQEVNDHVTDEEITELEAHRNTLDDQLAHARLRIEAVRLVWCKEAY